MLWTGMKAALGVGLSLVKQKLALSSMIRSPARPDEPPSRQLVMDKARHEGVALVVVVTGRTEIFFDLPSPLLGDREEVRTKIGERDRVLRVVLNQSLIGPATFVEKVLQVERVRQYHEKRAFSSLLGQLDELTGDANCDLEAAKRMPPLQKLHPVWLAKQSRAETIEVREALEN